MDRQRTYKTEAIILSRRNIGEADRLLTVFSKTHGKLRVVAKGVRRPTSRKRGSLELFNRVTIFLVKGKSLDIITEAEVKDSYGQWRGDLLRVGVAYHLVEVVNKLTREGQEIRRVYELLDSALSNLAEIDYWQMHEFLSIFKRQVLEELGFLSKNREIGDLDNYIEELSQSKLKTTRFLKSLA